MFSYCAVYNRRCKDHLCNRGTPPAYYASSRWKHSGEKRVSAHGHAAEYDDPSDGMLLAGVVAWHTVDPEEGRK
jgi:hypothetical protein